MLENFIIGQCFDILHWRRQYKCKRSWHVMKVGSWCNQLLGRSWF